MNDKFKVLFSSQSDNWKTPHRFFNELNKEFDFNFDPCPHNLILDGKRFPQSKDGLLIDWRERNFINPPYSEWQKWIRKGYKESKKGKLCVFLIASRTDTKAFHEIILPYAKEIRFIKGRLRFSEYNNSAPFPSCIVVFDGRK